MIITLAGNGTVKQGEDLSERRPSKLTDTVTKSRILLGSSAPEEKAQKKEFGLRKKKSIVELTRTERRPIFERIIDPILEDNTPKIERITLNETRLKDEKSNHFRFDVLGKSSTEERIVLSEKPIWREVLDEHRSQLSKRTISERIQQEQISDYRLRGENSWPSELPSNKNYTYLNWIICSENIQATKLTEEIIEHAGYRFNPVLIMGQHSTGKSHLSWAIGQAIQRIHGKSSVRLISCSTFSIDDTSDNEWSETLTLSKALIIENIDLIFENEEICLELSKIVEWALNIGVQVILTCEDLSIDDFPKGKLLNVISSAVRCQLNQYSKFSLITMLRSLATKRNVLISDNAIEGIVNNSDGKWPSCSSIFETVCMALESGASVESTNDIEAIIDGRPQSLYMSSTEDDMMIDDDKLARQIGKAAIEKIINSKEHTEGYIEEVFDDIVADELFKRPLVTNSGEPWFGGELPSKISSKVRGELESLSQNTLETMVDIGVNFEDRASKLKEIEYEMIEISNSIGNSNTTELLTLADRLIQLDSDLSQLKVGSNAPEENEFDDYTPDGEWNIDEDNVSVEELLNLEDNKPKVKRKAKRRKAKRKAKTHPKKTKRNILIPVEDFDSLEPEIKVMKTLVPTVEEG